MKNQERHLQVKTVLKDLGILSKVFDLPASTRTSSDAAQAIGCEIARIAKSLVFKTSSGKYVLVIASGSNRVNEKLLAKAIGESATMATPDEVLTVTGYAVGGVPPVAHQTALPTYIDNDLLAFKTVWAAAGTDHSVFEITPEQLIRITLGSVVTIA